MRVALVVPDLKPESGGPARNVPALAEALGTIGTDVEVHTIGDVPCARSPRVSYHSSPSLPPHRLGWSPGLMAGLASSSPDVIHAHCLWMMPLGYANRAARWKDVPLVISPRGMFASWSLRRSPIKKALATHLVHPGAFRNAAAWHATSDQEAADIRGHGHDQPVFVVPNGILDDDDSAAAQDYYRRSAPELGGRRTLLFYSRFHPKKRVLELLADFAALSARHGEWHLLLVGIPEVYSVQELRAEAARLGIEERTTVLDGTGAPKPYHLADLMALPTFSENFGQVVAEALAAAVPVITTTGTPWADLNQRRAGRWVPVADFARELDLMMGYPPSELRAAGERGRDWVKATFEWGAIASRMVAAYDQVLRAWSDRKR